MDSTAPRWYVRVPIDPANWESVQAQLYDHPVEAVVEYDSEALVYFTAPEPAGEFSREFHAEVEISEAGSGQVFGDGQHPTTQLCLRLAESTIQPGYRVADIGSGTGVLSRAALQLGAAFAVGCDLDAPAARLTSLHTHGVLGSAECLATAAFDAILANLHLAALRATIADIVRVARPHAKLVIGGLLEEQRPEALALLGEFGLRVTRELSAEGWIGVVATRNDVCYSVKVP